MPSPFPGMDPYLESELWTSFHALTRLDEPLPAVPVPLLVGDEDVPLDLQRAFNACYDEGHFELLVDYSKAPAVALNESDSAWADQVLRGAGKQS